MNILITICARGGSKGIPGKNIKLLAGKPLIEYTFIIARKFREYHHGTHIALSTDSQEIIDVASSLGVDTPYKRPEILATDDAGKIGAIKDVLFFYEKLHDIKYDYILDLDVTSPLRSMNDLSSAFDIILKDSDAYNLFSVSPANRSPYFNMVEKRSEGYYDLIKKLPTDVLTRQSAPKVFDLNASFYFYRRKFFELNLQSAITDKSLIYEVPHICFDLDHKIDYDFLSFLILQEKIDFDWI